MATPETIKASILAHASENSLLLVKLSSTSEKPLAFQNHQVKIAHLQEELKKQETELQKISEDVEARFKQHKSLRDSTLRRLIHRATLMGAKFEAKAMKEEKDYIASLGAQSKTSERLAHLKQNLDEDVANLGLLEKGAKEHEETHARIDELYEDLFAGPTPGFPVEDELESRYYSSNEKNEAVKSYIRASRRVLRLLQRAINQLKRAKNCLETAQQATDNSILFFDDAISLIKESGEYIVYALTAVDQAKENISPISAEAGATREKVVELLNAARKPVKASLSRAIITSAIEASQENIVTAENQLTELIETMKTKEREALEHIKQTARKVEDSRQALQQNRQGIFEQVAGFGEAAPAYSECCDRADSFCVVPSEGDVEEPEVDEPGVEDPVVDGPVVEEHGNDPDSDKLPAYH
jgi:hypothetical protein